MKRSLLVVLCILQFNCIKAQPTLRLVQKTKLENTEKYWGHDALNELFLSNKSTLEKHHAGHKLTFTDFQLGPITTVSLLNPLKTMVFYQSTNTLVFLDNFLNEIKRVNFSQLSTPKNLLFAQAGKDRSIWIFEEFENKLILYDYNADNDLYKSPVLEGTFITMDSNYNSCWVLTSKNLYHLNLYATVLEVFPNDNYETLDVTQNGVYIKQNDLLQFIGNSTNATYELKLPEIRVEEFYVQHEILYIYNGNTIFQYQLNSQKNN